MNSPSDINSKKKKILIMGLDQAGKSCIAKCLQGIKNLPAFTVTKPTIGHNKIDFHALGLEFIIMDFSGQEAYRDDHLKNFNNYIRDTNKFIYVIDIQDIGRYKNALVYLKKIINSLHEEIEKMDEFSVFLHKCDPDLEKVSKIINESAIKKLVDQIKGLFPPDFHYAIYKTSIYTSFEKTIIY